MTNRVLHIENILVSLPKAMVVRDEDGFKVYEAISNIGLLSADWTVYRGDDGVAKLRKTLGFKETWEVSGILGDFRLHQQVLSFTRALEVEGGRFNGAVLHGNILDRNFTFELNGTVLAKVQARLVSMSDHHSIEFFELDEDAELMAIIGMVCVHSDHKDRKR